MPDADANAAWEHYKATEWHGWEHTFTEDLHEAFLAGWVARPGCKRPHLSGNTPEQPAERSHTAEQAPDAQPVHPVQKQPPGDFCACKGLSLTPNPDCALHGKRATEAHTA